MIDGEVFEGVCHHIGANGDPYQLKGWLTLTEFGVQVTQGRDGETLIPWTQVLKVTKPR